MIERPSAFLELVGGILVALVVALAIGSAIASKEGPMPAVVGWIFAGLILVFVAMVILYPPIVVLLIAAGRPAPRPLRERNLLFARVGALFRFGAGYVLLVLGGFFGGIIALQMNGIAGLQAAATGEFDQGAEAAVRDANVQFVRLVQDWTQGAMILLYVAALVALVSLGIELLVARKSGRLEALQRVMRIDGSGLDDPDRSSVRRVWAEHLSHWAYPALFLFVAGSVASLAVVAVGTALDAVFGQVIESL